MLFSKHLSYHTSSHTGGNIQGNLGLSISLKDTRPPPAVPLKSVMLHEQISAEPPPPSHMEYYTASGHSLHSHSHAIHMLMWIAQSHQHVTKRQVTSCKMNRKITFWWVKSNIFLKCHAIRHILFQQIHLLYVTSSLTSFTKYSGQNRNTFSTVKTAGSESSVLCLVCSSLRPL